MAGRESQEMRDARAMVLGGMTPYAAAKVAGITSAAIYMSKWYKEWRNQKTAKPAQSEVKKSARNAG